MLAIWKAGEKWKWPNNCNNNHAVWGGRQYVWTDSFYVPIQGLFPWRAESEGWLLHIELQQVCPNLRIPTNAEDKFCLHFPRLKAAPDGFLVAQHIPKCISAWLFLQKRGWRDNGQDRLSPPANETWGQLMTQLDAVPAFPVHAGCCLCRQHWVLWRLHPLSWGITNKGDPNCSGSIDVHSPGHIPARNVKTSTIFAMCAF